MNRTMIYVRMLAVIMLVGAVSCSKKDKPKTLPTVTTSINITDITTTSAKGGGNITSDGNSTITESGLVYSSTVSEPTIADSKVVETVASGSFTAMIEDLSSGKNYHVRAYATNEAGTAYGMVVDFMTGNAAPTVTEVKIEGAAVVGEELTVTYKYDDAEGDIENGTSIQWYMADATDGTNETAITDATSSSFTMPQALFGKNIRVGVTPKAATGTPTGVEVKSAFKDGEPTTVTFSYMNNSVTYGILISAKTGRKWMDRNLGAAAAPSSLTDFANYGDLFQWGRLADGHQTITRTGTTNDKVTGVTGTISGYAGDKDIPTTDKFFVVPQDAPFDWRNPSNDNLWGQSGANNPCPTGWHVPTQEEWAAEAVDNTITNMNEAFSALNITYTGFRAGTFGTFYYTDTDAMFWSSTTTNSPSDHYAICIDFYDGLGYSNFSTFRSGGCAIRCIRNL